MSESGVAGKTMNQGGNSLKRREPQSRESQICIKLSLKMFGWLLTAWV